MSFVYSFYPSYDQVVPNFYSLFSQQPQLHPTTILISNFQACSDSIHKSDFLNPVLQTQTPNTEQLIPCEPRKPVNLEKKPSKKENSRKKDQNFGWRNQNKDRNMLSGILKGYIQFTLNSQAMIKLIEDLSKKLQVENGVSSFYKFIADTFPQKKSYVGIKFMKEVLRQERGTKEFIHMLGMTLKHYLKAVYPLTVCQGSKLKKKVKLSLLKKVRNIVAMIF